MTPAWSQTPFLRHLLLSSSLVLALVLALSQDVKAQTPSLSSSTSSSSFVLPEVWALPNGIEEGRESAPLGAYTTQYSDQVRPYQTRLESLRQKISGLHLISARDFVAQAEAIYLLEFELVALLEELASGRRMGILDSVFEYSSLNYRTLEAYRDLRTHAARVYDNMLRIIDVAIPGPNGPQLRVETGTRFALYEPNHRSDTPLTEAEKQTSYQSRLNAFLQRGSLSEIHTVDRNWFLGLGAFTAAEYVVTEDSRIRATTGRAGHLLLAEGGRVRAAGNLAILKTPQNEILLLVVSSSSGTYKPDVFSARQAAEQIAHTLGAQPDRVLVVRGEPFGLQSFKILLKARGIDPAVITARTNRLENLTRGLLAAGSGLRCRNVFEP